MRFGSPLNTKGALGLVPKGQPQSSYDPKILLIKVVRSDSLMINVPFIGLLTYCVASGKL